MSWYDGMVAAGNIRYGVAAVHEVLGSPALETPVNCHSELMEDSLRNNEPVQLGVEQTCQTSHMAYSELFSSDIKFTLSIIFLVLFVDFFVILMR